VAQSGERNDGVFTGEYRHTIDAKGRLAVPARFRSELAGESHVCRWIDGCLAIFPQDAWGHLAAQIGGLARVGDARAREFARSVFASAFPVELDGQGRVLVPSNLRAMVGLESDAVVVGLNDHVELWSPERWTTYSAAMNEPDEFAARLSGLEI
jgi:transcriptional regulator MraZ